MNQQQQHFVIIGSARSGIASAKLLLHHGIRVTLCDDQPEQNLKYFASSGLKDHAQLTLCFNAVPVTETHVDAVVLSPGVPENHPLIRYAREKNLHIYSEIDIATRFIPTQAKIIGITGTNGKSTTTVMLTNILTSAGFRAIACGNIGRPLAEVVLSHDASVDYFVVELSSFQLASSSFLRLHAALILNITPDHLDRHGSLEDYCAAKLKIISFVHANGAVVCGQDLRHLVEKKTSTAIYFDTDFAQRFPNIVMVGPNQENALAAATLASALRINHDDIVRGLQNFKALPHRCEPIADHHGVLFINDSKGTTVESVKKALASIQRPIHLLLGGLAKNQNFSALRHEFFPHVKQYYLFGHDQSRIEADLTNSSCGRYATLNDAFAAALGNMNAGDAIVLSPGCASFDQFNDYEERGDFFRSLVHQIIAGTTSCAL